MDQPPTSDLCDAANRGDAAEIKRAIGAKANLDSGHFNGGRHVPIILAAASGHADCVRILIEAGSVVDAEGQRGETATMRAAMGNHRDCLAALISAGADVNARDWPGMTPAMYAARHGAGKDLECLRMLIEAGADLRPTDLMRRTAATHAKISASPAMAALINGQIASLDESKRLARALRAKPAMAGPRAVRL